LRPQGMSSFFDGLYQYPMREEVLCWLAMAVCFAVGVIVGWKTKF
jgi:hypothetical protein